MSASIEILIPDSFTPRLYNCNGKKESIYFIDIVFNLSKWLNWSYQGEDVLQLDNEEEKLKIFDKNLWINGRELKNFGQVYDNSLISLSCDKNPNFRCPLDIIGGYRMVRAKSFNYISLVPQIECNDSHKIIGVANSDSIF